MNRGKVKTRVGIVKSNKMDKTVIVNITNMVKDRLYKKHIKRTTTFIAHDENNECVVGDKVLIMESRPLSKTKKWRVSKILEKISGAVPETAEPSIEEGAEQ